MSRHGYFTPASDLLRAKIRELGEARGFSATRLLTHWPEIVGESIAAIAKPLEVRHPRGKKAAEEGATLTILALGAAALRLEMEKERLRERVNACYGYNAIAKIRIKQAGPESFTAGPAPVQRPPVTSSVPPSPSEPLANGVSDTELRLALAALAANVLSKSRT
ncbi:DUF721 domain-containing protein [Rubellimicrobium rubrum]|uniref:DUF721 domain-containing protein n=1 Tax=Rubellimicrobium rubrum TaxID=2585369 RepID=UPI00159B8E66|nr:DUF721 domain-containing protein [Rubellimicrobium rubrum]